MKLLIIDNNLDRDCWGATDLRRLSRLAVGATIAVRRGPADDLPRDPSGFDRVVISGSRTSALEDAPWIDSLFELIRKTIDQRKPLLGVCYGHQALVRAIGGKDTVRRAEQAEYGWTKVETLESNPLLQGLPRSFYSFSAHFEEVNGTRLPGVLRRLARSEDCEVQAVQLGGLPIFGIQFHPEKDVADAKKTFDERKRKGTPSRLLHPKESEKLYDPKVGETIFRNFLSL